MVIIANTILSAYMNTARVLKHVCACYAYMYATKHVANENL